MVVGDHHEGAVRAEVDHAQPEQQVALQVERPAHQLGERLTGRLLGIGRGTDIDEEGLPGAEFTGHLPQIAVVIDKVDTQYLRLAQHMPECGFHGLSVQLAIHIPHEQRMVQRVGRHFLRQPKTFLRGRRTERTHTDQLLNKQAHGPEEFVDQFTFTGADLTVKTMRCRGRPQHRHTRGVLSTGRFYGVVGTRRPVGSPAGQRGRDVPGDPAR